MAEFDSILILAIFLQLISTSVNYIGMTIQKKAATKIPKIGPETGYRRSLKNLIINKAWVFGLGLNASSTFFAAGAFALASITIIQPLYGFGLIVLVIFNSYHEVINFLFLAIKYTMKPMKKGMIHTVKTHTTAFISFFLASL